MMTKSNVIGFIAAFDIYNCNMNAAGLTAGAKSVNPDVQVLVDLSLIHILCSRMKERFV